MFVVPIQTYILIYKKIYEHWGVAGTLASSTVKNDLYSMTKMVSVKVKWMQTITSFSIWKSTINE